MITEDYVSFETAKLLKEKGFNETCRAYWGGFNNKPLYLCDCNSGKAFDYCNNRMLEKDYSDYEQTYIAAPTHQMAMKWLREVHNLYIDIRININNSLYSFKIYSVGISGARAFTDYRIESYEQACEAAIKYSLENLI